MTMQSSPMPGTQGPSPDEDKPPQVPNLVTAHQHAMHAEGLGFGGHEPAGELRQALALQSAGPQVHEGRSRQQATLVRLGLQALASRNLNGTLNMLVREAAAALGVEFCSVVERSADGTRFSLRADFGCPPTMGTDELCVLGSEQALYTLQSAVPVVSADLRAETRFTIPAAGLQYGARSGMSVTLHGKQQAWGVIGVYAKTLREFTDEDTTFLQAIANLMALAIEANQAEAALRTRNRFQAAVVRLGLEALASQELDDTLDLLVREAGATLRTDSCCVLELEADRTRFRLRASFGWPVGSQGPAEDGSRHNSQAQYTLQALEPVVSADLRRETRFKAQASVLAQGAISSMSVILQGKQQAWGVLGCHTKTARLFTADDSGFLQGVANLMALAIERAAAESLLRQRNLQQAAVALLGRRALAGPHMDDLFAEAAREVSETLDVEICDILQRTPTGQTLVLRAGVGWQSGLVGAARVPAGNGSQAGYTLSAPGPVIVEDQRTETRFETASILQDHGIVSSMSVLVPGRAGPFGVLGAHARAHRTFTQDDSNFLQAVANLLAGAIERHRVEGELRRHRHNLEGLVEERTALLAASNRELEAFSYTISHDLRAPLRSINGLSKLIQRKHAETLPPEAQEMLQRVADETVRMGRLIESILALSRLGSVHLTRVPVDVSAMAQSVLGSLQAADPERKVAWTVDPDVSALADEALLRLLLENLLGNAWKFTRRTPEATIKLGRDAEGFHVEDNGAGFDMAHARELFQPFHRLHAADDFEGTGIGLATVSRIVGRHGGRIWAQGAIGQGATFRVTLPASVSPGVEAAPRTYVPLHPVWQPSVPGPAVAT